MIIGGYAFSAYCEPRYTTNLDLWVATDRKNARAIYKVLKEFGAPVGPLKPSDFESPGLFFIFGREPVRIDILTRLKGMAFESAYRDSELLSIQGSQCRFVSLEYLIRLKELAGRPQDKLDLRSLRVALKERSVGGEGCRDWKKAIQESLSL